jgi:hypothetical protein
LKILKKGDCGRTENPRVTSSSLVPGITSKPLKHIAFRGF